MTRISSDDTPGNDSLDSMLVECIVDAGQDE
jgi:hypothetical protein